MKTRKTKRAVAGLMSVLMTVGMMNPAAGIIRASAADYDIVAGSAKADPSTKAIEDAFTLNANQNGKILADKTVQYVSGDNFDVTLSALAQSYTNVVGTTTNIEAEIHPDIVFVVDMSSSMVNNKIGSETRAKVTVKAMNNAIAQLMEADPETRIGIVSYASNFGAGNNLSNGVGSDALYLPLDNYTYPKGSTEYVIFNKEAATTPITVPDAFVTVEAKAKLSDTNWLYPATGTSSTEEFTNRDRISVDANGNYKYYKAGSTTATANDTLASGSYRALDSQYTLLRVGDYYYVYDTTKNEIATTFTNVPEERTAFVTDGGDTFYAASLNGSAINIYIDNESSAPIATLNSEKTADSFRADDCDYFLTWNNGTSFSIRSEGTADVKEDYTVANTARSKYTVNNKDFYILSTDGKIEIYTTAANGAPVATVSNSILTDEYQTYDSTTDITTTYTFTKTSDTSVTVSYSDNVRMYVNGITTTGKTINCGNYSYFVKNKLTTFTISNGTKNKNVIYIYKNASDAEDKYIGRLTINSGAGYDLPYFCQDFTDLETGVHFIRYNKATSSNMSDNANEMYVNYPVSASVSSQLTNIPVQQKTTCRLGTGDTIYLLVSNGTMKIYSNPNDDPIYSIEPGKTSTLVIGSNNYSIENNNNQSLTVFYQEDVSASKTVADFNSKLACPLSNGTTFYVTVSGKDGGRVIKVYDSANATTPIATSGSGRFTYNSTEYLVKINGDSGVTISYLTNRTGSATKTMNVPATKEIEGKGTDVYALAVNQYLIGSNGNPVGTHTAVGFEKGTYTQIGLKGAMDMFCATEDTDGRVPVIVLVSDGEPTLSFSDVKNPDIKANQGETNGPTGDDAYCTVRTAMYVKEMVDAHYAEGDALFYSIGPGVTSDLGKAVLYPSGKDNESDAQTYFEKCQNHASLTFAQFYEKIMYAVDNDPDVVDLNYVNYADWGIMGDLNAEQLMQGFQDIVGFINDIPRPITSVTIVDSKTSTQVFDGKNMVFTDTIGDGMSLTCVDSNGNYDPMNLIDQVPVIYYCNDNTAYTTTGGTPSNIYDKNGNKIGTKITFRYNCNVTETSTGNVKNLNEMEANLYIYDSGKQKIEWKIPAELVPTIFPNPTTGNFDTASPIRLKYRVHLATEETGTYYTNSTAEPATCTFVPSKGNPYYYNSELDAAGQVVSAFIYDGTNPYTGTADGKNKTNNNTGTADYAWNFETDEAGGYGVVVENLGNNGVISIKANKIAPDSVVIDYGLPVEVNATANDGLTGTITGIATSVTDGTVLDTQSYAASRLGEDKVTKADDALEMDHGTVTFNDTSVIYTPTDMQITEEQVIYYEFTSSDSGNKYYSTVTVIPATIIYYEDSFMTYVGDWQDVGETKTVYQHTDLVGAKDANNYGYDAQYLNCDTYSLGSAKMLTVDSTNTNNKSTSYAEFTFTGTSFDLISVTSGGTGTTRVICKTSDGQVYDYYDENGKHKNGNWVVDCYYGYNLEEENVIKNTWRFKNGAWSRISQEAVDAMGDDGVTQLPEDAENGDIAIIYTGTWTPGDKGTLYQIPVMRSPEMPYDTYTVTVAPVYSRFYDHTKVGYYDFYMDAVRVYNPANTGSLISQVVADAYSADAEAYPDFLELKDVVTASEYTGDEVTGILFLDGYTTSTLGENDGTTIYNQYGPNNEVYLQPGQSFAFIIEDANGANMTSVQIAARIFEDADAKREKRITTVEAPLYKTRFIINTNDLYYVTNVGGNFSFYANETDEEPLITLTATHSTGSFTTSKATYTFTRVDATHYTYSFGSDSGTYFFSESMRRIDLENDCSVYTVNNSGTFTIYTGSSTIYPVAATLTADYPTATYSVGGITYTFTKVDDSTVSVEYAKADTDMEIHYIIAANEPEPVEVREQITLTAGDIFYVTNNGGTFTVYNAETGGTALSTVDAESTSATFTYRNKVFNITREGDDSINVEYLPSSIGFAAKVNAVTSESYDSMTSFTVDGITYYAYQSRNPGYAKRIRVYRNSTDEKSNGWIAQVMLAGETDTGKGTGDLSTTYTNPDNGITYTIVKTADKQITFTPVPTTETFTIADNGGSGSGSGEGGGSTEPAEETALSARFTAKSIKTLDEKTIKLPSNKEEYETATDLYYDITEVVSFRNGKSNVIMITNTGEALISFTNLKITHTKLAEPTMTMAAAPRLMMTRAAALSAIETANADYLATVTVQPEAAAPEAKATPTFEPKAETPTEPDDPTDPTDPTEPDEPDEPTDPKEPEEETGFFATLKRIFQKILAFFVRIFQWLKQIFTNSQ